MYHDWTEGSLLLVSNKCPNYSHFKSQKMLSSSLFMVHMCGSTTRTPLSIYVANDFCFQACFD